MGIDNIRHPIKDTVKADNSTYSSNKIESLIHSATELPETGVEDVGKVVTVVSDGDEGAKYGLTNLPDSDIFYFNVRLLQASTSSAHDVVLMGLTGTSFDDAKSALDAGKRVVARITVFDELPTDITFRWTTRHYTIKKGDIHFMDFGGYIQGKTGAPMFYRGYFPPYDDATQGPDGFRMIMFTPDHGTEIDNQVNVYLDN